MTLTQNPPQQSSHIKPFWQQPTSIFTGILGFAIVAYPIFQDTKIPRIKSVLYTDVSLSDQAFTKENQTICHQRLEKLIEGDIRIDGKFADQTIVLNNQEYQSKERLNLQNACQNILLPPPGIGKQKGTNLMLTLKSLDLELQKQRTLGNNEKAVIIISINAAEPGPNQSPVNLKQLKTNIQKLTESNNTLVFIGPEMEWQSKLKTILSDVKNTNVCTYPDSQSCVNWGFEQARK